MTAAAVLDRYRVNWGRRFAFHRTLLNLVPTATWPFNEVTGVLAFDASGGNTGTISGSPTLAAGALAAEDSILGASIDFDGVNDFVQVPDATSATASGTIGALADTFTLVFPVALGALGTKRYLIAKGANAAALYIGTDNLVHLEKKGVGDIAASTVALDTNPHLVVVVKSGAMSTRIFIDDLDVTGSVTDRTCVDTATDLYIGQDGASGGWFLGRVSRPAVLLRAISRAEHARLATSFAYGEFSHPLDDITSRVGVNAGSTVTNQAGRNADLSGEMIGELTIPDCENVDHYFSPDRNLCLNPDAAYGLDSWVTAALGGVTAAASDLIRRRHPFSGSGDTWSVEGSLSAVVNSGFYQLVPGLFRANVPITVEAPLESLSGNTNVQIGLVSWGTPATLAGSAGTIGAYGLKSATLTPSVDITDLVVFVRTTTAAAASVAVGRIQINVGATANPYLAGPTQLALQPRAPVQWRATLVATGHLYDRFFGAIETIQIDGDDQHATLVCRDPEQTYDAKASVSVTASTHRQYTSAVLDAAIAAAEGAYRNLCFEGSFESGVSVLWTVGAGVIADTVYAADGTHGLKIPIGGSATYVQAEAQGTGEQFYAGRWYRSSFWAKSRGASSTMALSWGDASPATSTEIVTGTPRQVSILWQCPTDTFVPPLAITSVAGSIFDIDAVVITEGLPVRAFTPYYLPIGRQPNWIDPTWPYAVDWIDGWSNKLTNPEAAVNAAGWTAAGATGGIDFAGTSMAGSDDVDRNVYTTASWTPSTARLYLVLVHTGHANTVTLAGNGLTWTSVATVASGSRRLTVFRSVGIGAAGTMTITVSGGGTATFAAWQAISTVGIDSTGVGAANAIVQSVAVAASTATLGSAIASPFAPAFLAMAVAGGTVPTVAADSRFTSPSAAQTNTAPAEALNYAVRTLGGARSASVTTSGFTPLLVLIELKPATALTSLARVTGSYIFGQYTTAFQITGAADGEGAWAAVPGTLRAGRTYRFLYSVDNTSSLDWTVGLRSLSDDTEVTDIVHVSGAVPVIDEITFTPPVDVTDGVVYFAPPIGAGASASSITFTALDVSLAVPEPSPTSAGPGRYVAVGFASPAALSEASSISTGNADATTSRGSYTRITTYAVAGSGAALMTHARALLGSRMSVAVLARLVSGGPSVAFGVGDPLGANADAVTQTFTLTAGVWTKIPLVWNPSRTIGAGIGVPWLYAMTPSATAVTFDVADEQLLYGTQLQDFLPRQAAGIDANETDVLETRSIDEQPAISELRSVHAMSLGIQRIDYLAAAPWWQLTTIARRSLDANLAVAETLLDTSGDPDSAIVGYGGFELDARDVYPGVMVSYADGIVVLYDSDTAALGTDGFLEVDGTGVLDATSAAEVAALLLRRVRLARYRPTLQVSEARATTLLERRPGDLIAVTSVRHLEVDERYLVLSTRDDVSQGGRARLGTYELQRYVY